MLIEVLYSFMQSFNPMSEPNDDWTCKFDESPELNKSNTQLLCSKIVESRNKSLASGDVDYGFTFPTGQSGPEDDDEVTESKIREFLDEKVSSGMYSCILSRLPQVPRIIQEIVLYKYSLRLFTWK